MKIVRWTLGLLIGFGLVTEGIWGQDSEDRVHYVDSIFDLVHQMDSIEAKLDVLESQANYYHDFAPWTKIFLDSALAIAEKSGIEKEVAVATFNQMQYYVFNTQFDSALSMYDVGLALPVVQREPGLRSDFYAQLATLRKKQGNAKEAIRNFVAAMELLDQPHYLTSLNSEKEKIGAKRSLVIINNNLANLYQDLGEYPSAHRAYQKAYDLLVEMDEKAIAGTVWMNKGSIYLQQQNYDSAYIIQVEAQRLKEEGDAGQRARAMSNLNVGNALLGLKRFAEAEEQLNQALSIFETLENRSGMANALVDRGRLKLALRDFQGARHDCENGKEIAKQVNQLDYQHKACDCLHQVYKNLGNYKLALENHEALKTLHDSVRNSENTKYLTQLEMQYEFDRAEEKRLIATNTARLLQLEKDKRNQRAFILLSILLASAIFASYLLFRNFQIKKRSENELSNKNSIISKALDEKEILLKEIHHRVKNNLQVISSLLKLQSKYVEDDAALDAISAGRNRVRSMALLHENLYQDDNLKGVDMQVYIDKLIDGLFNSLNTREERIKLVKRIEPIQLDIDSVVPIGLIANELITNSLKHAFAENEEGEISVSLYEHKRQLILEVADTGKGLPTNFFEGKINSFGHKLIRAFVNNLDAEVDVQANPGTKIRIIINKFEKAA